MDLTDQIIIKRANTDYPILDAIANRWSSRAFRDRPVNEEVLMRLFEAARWAPSSMNKQPWRFIYAHKESVAHSKIVEALNDNNRKWAANAPVLIIALVKTGFSNSNFPNGTAYYDLGLAIGNFSIQATVEGMGLHQMGGFSPSMARGLFGIPEGYEAVTAIALGYFGDPDQLTEPLRSREMAGRSRKPLKEIVFKESFEL